MSSIDQRVVQMQFDNAQFEAGVRQSQQTLKNFDKTLQSENGTEGLSKLGQAVEIVKDRLSNMGIVGITIIQNLTNSAINFAKRLASEFTIEPIKQGLGEYENQLNSVQTMMANTGRSVQDVNRVMDQLNVYADKTIYSFGDMASNMGRFTVAGVGLEDSASAIQGIANLAAMSGSNTQQASSAMYQLSQAIASGKVNLMDWNSVVNAGMGGTKFQEALMRTAEAQGIVIDRSKSFRESISGQDSWLTGDILLETLKQIGGEYDEAALRSQGFTEQQIQDILEMAKTAEDAATVVKTFTQLIDTLKEAIGSGWAQSFRIVIGDFEEAKVLWTGVNRILSDLINTSAEARNAMLNTWKEMGGRDALINSFSNAWQGLLTVITPIKRALEQVFPPMTGERLAELTKRLEEFTGKLRLSGEAQYTLESIMKGLFTVIKMGVSVVRSLGQVFGTFVVPVIVRVVEVIGSMLGALGRLISGFDGAIPSGDNFQAMLNHIKESLGPVGEFLKNVTQGIVDFFNSLGRGTSNESNLAFFDSLVEKLKSIKDKIQEVLGPIANAIGNFFKPITDAISNAVGNMTLLDWSKVFATGGIAAVMAAITKFVHSFGKIFGSISDLIDEVKDSFAGGDGIIDKFKGVFDVLQAYQNQLNAQAIRNIAIAVGILAASMFVIASIDSGKLLPATAAMGALFAELVGAVTLMQVVSKKISAAGPGMISGSASLIAMSAAILILSGALKRVSEIAPEDLLKGVLALGALVAIVGVMAEISTKFSNQKGLISGAVAMGIFALAMKELAKVVGELGSIDTNALMKGLGGVLALVVMITGFIAATSNTIGSQGVSAGLGILAISAALLVMSKAVGTLGSMNLSSLAKGLVGVGASMAILAAGLIAVSKFAQGGVAGAAAMVVASAAMVILAQAVKAYTSLSLESLAQGLIALGASMAILVVGLNLMNGTLAGSAALLIASIALGALVPVVAALGALPIPNLVQGLVALAAAMAIMGVAGYALAGAVPGMLGLGAALALIGASVFLVGTGISALAAGVTLLAASGVAGAAAFVTSMGVLLDGLVRMIPAIAAALVDAITQFITNLAARAGELANAAVTLVLQFLNALRTVIPELVNFGLEMIVALLTGIANNMEQIVTQGGLIIAGFINGIANSLGDIIQAGMNLVVSLIDGIANGISENAERVAEAMRHLGESLIEAFCTILGIHSPSTVMEEQGGNIVTGLINGILSFLGNADSTIIQLGASLVQNIVSFVGNFFSAGVSFIQNVVNGIGSMIGTAINTVVSLVQSMVDNARSFTGNFLNVGREFIQNVVSGVGQMLGTAVSSIVSVVQSMVQNAMSFLGNFLNAGRQFVSNIASGIWNMAGSAWSAITGVVQSAVSNAMSFVGNFLSAGREFVSNIVSGISGMAGSAIGAIAGVCNDIVNRANNFVSDMVNVGRNIIQGLIDGIRDMASQAVNAARGVVDDTIEGAKNLLGIASPSKVFIEIGKFIDQGLVLGLKNYQDRVRKQSESVADITKQAFDGVLGNEGSPVIKPVLDLSDLSDKASMISSMLNNGATYALGLAGSISGSMTDGEQVQVSPLGNVVNNNFVQNNYSPTALNRLEIYRQTRNQFAMAKEALAK